MKKVLLIFSVFACLFFSIVAEAKPLPNGSYLQTCNDCYMKHNVLSCACKDRNGVPRNTSLRAPYECNSVENINGNLQCTQANYPPPHRPHHKRVFDVQAGPIWNQRVAEHKCPHVCGRYQAKWTGQWRTTIPGQMSICGCEYYGHRY